MFFNLSDWQKKKKEKNCLIKIYQYRRRHDLHPVATNMNCTNSLRVI